MREPLSLGVADSIVGIDVGWITWGLRSSGKESPAPGRFVGSLRPRQTGTRISKHEPERGTNNSTSA